MPILDKKDVKMQKKIDTFFKKSKYSSLYQSFEWAKVKSDKWKNEVVYLEENGEIIGAMLVLIRKLGFFSMMYAPRGPICNVYDIKTVNRLVEQLKPLVKKYKVFVLKMSPEEKYDKELEKIYKKNKYIVKNNIKDILELMSPLKGMILPVGGKSIDGILSEYSPKTRYNIRLAAKKGVQVRYSRDETDLRKFYELMQITGVRDRIPVRAYQHFKSIINSYDGDMSKIYLAEYEGETLAAAIAIKYGDTVKYIYGASSNQKRNVMPNYLMQQTMIEWAINNKCEKYDFGEVFATTKENGLYKFKEGFCRRSGCTEFIGEIDKVYNKPYYILYNKLFPVIEKIVMKIK